MAVESLRGKTAIVTGGGSGIGLAVARRLVQDDCRTVITGRSEAKLRIVWEEMGRDPRLLFRACDVSEADQAQALIDWSMDRLGRVDVLVNNAGINIKERGIEELDPDTWRNLLGINLDGAFYCIHAVLPHMIARRDGLIINISSVAGKRATPLGGAGYAASKFGMTALSHCMGVELKDRGIRCSVVFPGEVDTPILEHRPEPVTGEHRARILQPDDVADAVVFIAKLPPRVNVPELIIKPTSQPYM